MSISTEVINHCWSIIIFTVVAISLCCIMLICGWFLGSRTCNKCKNIPFESGINSVGSARLRLSAKFYLTAMFFVIFEVESLYIFVWSIAIREVGWIGFIEATVFISILLISLIYLMRIGALNWKSSNLKHKIYYK